MGSYQFETKQETPSLVSFHKMKALIIFIFFCIFQMQQRPHLASPIIDEADPILIELLINDERLLTKRSMVTNHLDENEDYPKVEYEIVKKAGTDDLGNDSKTLFYFGEDINDLENLPISVFRKYLADTISKIKLRL